MLYADGCVQSVAMTGKIIVHVFVSMALAHKIQPDGHISPISVPSLSLGALAPDISN